MTSLFDRLNLRPQERRLVVVVVIVIFVVVNLVFIRPHFSDWATLNAELKKADDRRVVYQAEAKNLATYQARLKKLEGQGSSVLPEDQANNLVRAINSQATQSRVITTRVQPRVTPRGSGPPGSNSSTNAVFFEEQTVGVAFVNTGDKELLDFLVAIGSGDLMVRVRDFEVKPDPSSGHSRLMGTISLVASYQRKAPPKKTSTPIRKP